MDNLFSYNLDFWAIISKTAEDTETGDWIIEGFAATSDLDFQNDEITLEGLETGATSLRNGGDLKFNHGEKIGKILDAKVTGTGVSKGIWIKALIFKTFSKIWKDVKEGILNRFSIQGSARASIKEWFHGKAINSLSKLNLSEASLVSIPANPEAKLLRYYVSKSAEDAFMAKFSPQSNKWVAEVDALSSDKRTFQGVVKVSPDIIDDIVSALKKVPTVCLNGDANKPIGVVEVANKLDDNSIYLKIRYSSDFVNPEGKVIIQGLITKSIDGVFLGFTPNGVSLQKELDMDPQMETLKSELATLAKKLEDQSQAMVQLRKEAETVKAAEEKKPLEVIPPENKPMDKPEEKACAPEEKACAPEEKAAGNMEIPPEDKEKLGEGVIVEEKAVGAPPEKKPEEELKPDPSSQSDVPPLKDPYPKPPVQKEIKMALEECMKKISDALKAMGEKGPEATCKTIEETCKSSFPSLFPEDTNPQALSSNKDESGVTEGLVSVGKALAALATQLQVQAKEISDFKADVSKKLSAVNSLTVSPKGEVNSPSKNSDPFAGTLFPHSARR